LKFLKGFCWKRFLSAKHSRSNGGWLEKKYLYMSWALSCLQLNKFYDNLELVTDELGYTVLIDKLRLPYKRVIVSMDRLNHYHNDLWAVGKLYAYSLQQEPFIHVDGDVFSFEKFDRRIENASLVAQNRLFIGAESFNAMVEHVLESFTDVPHHMRQSRQRQTFNCIYNSGIFGGHDIESILTYARTSLNFVNVNLELISRHIDYLERDSTTSFKTNAHDFLNSIIESYFFTSFAGNAKIECLLEDATLSGFKNARFLDAESTRVTYTHPMYHNKKDTVVCAQLEYKLKQGFPDHHYRILSLLDDFQI
jgi:hypothetical protein